MSGTLKTVFAFWLLLLGVALGKSAYRPEAPLEIFLLHRHEVTGPGDFNTQRAIRAAAVQRYDWTLEGVVCHGDPVNKVDVLGAAGILVDGGMVTPEGPGGSGKLAGLLNDGDSYRRVKLLDLFKEGNLPGFEGGVCDSSGGMR